jgi:hypothetical protein
MGEWIEVSQDNNSIFYIDESTIQREDDMVKMWGLLEYKSEQVVGKYRYLSQMTQYEFDCKEKQRRNFYSWFHSMRMGGGDVVYTIEQPEDKWSPVVPGTVGNKIWKIACGVN